MGGIIHSNESAAVKKVLVINPYIEFVGGGEEVLLKILEVLIERKYDVSLLGELPRGSIFDGLPLSSIKQHIPHGFEELPKFKSFQVYRAIFHRSKLKNNVRKAMGNFDLEIDVQNSQYFIGAGKKRVAYVHFPENMSRLKKPDLKYRWFWKLYYWPITFELKRLVKKTDLLLCNSCYTKSAIMEYWGRDAELVYPPVDVGDFRSLEKEFFVISVGRISPEKNYELVVEVARRMPDVKFVIAGRKNAQSYFDKLVALKPDNVDLVVDTSRGELSVLLGRAKVYLHCRVDEHFGISVGEAMAAGCISVVYNSGGPKEIVAEYGFFYNNVEECVKAIRAALQSDIDPTAIVKRAEMFSSDSFKKNFVAILEEKGYL